MSEDDFDLEIMEIAGLAGGGDKKRKKRQATSGLAKRRKASTSDSEVEDIESEEEDSSAADPYPLEGKFKNEADRQHLMTLNEIEREDILAQRLEEKQRILDKQNLDQMFRQQAGGGKGDDSSPSKAAKRQHAIRGATKEKSRKLDELKAKRLATADKKRHKGSSPKRARSSSPQSDMDMSESESEDGQITKADLEYAAHSRDITSDDDPPATVSDLLMIRLTREEIAKHCLKPWFPDYIRGAYVRFSLGGPDGKTVYRICEVQNIAPIKVKPYKIDQQVTDDYFEIKQGQSVKAMPMSMVSNGPFSAEEFRYFQMNNQKEKIKAPTRKQIEKKQVQMQRLRARPMTEEDLSAMLLRKNHLGTGKSTSALTNEIKIGQLRSQRNLAEGRHAWDEVADLDKQIASLAPVSRTPPIESSQDRLEKVNERNRKANLEAVRRAEGKERERKRQEKLKGAGLLAPVPLDPSARVKTIPKLFSRADPTSRGGTPKGTPTLKPQDNENGLRQISPLPSSALSKAALPVLKTSTTSLIDSVEIDLGDF